MNRKQPKARFVVRFPQPSQVRGKWCDTLDEARTLVARYPEDDGEIFVHFPLSLLGLK